MAALDKIAEVGDYETAAGASAGEVPVPRGPDAPDDLAQAFSFPLGLSIPVIGAINGAAAGVGFVVACFTDIRFAAAGAKLTTSFGRIGLPAEWGISWLLPRLVGAAHAADLLFSSRVMLAEEAARMGLVNEVVAPDALLPHALAYAHRLATEISPSSMRSMKRQLWADLDGRGLAASSADAHARMLAMTSGPEFAEGSRALSERRPPNFPDRS
jgi:enoyl-CoA hydratase/carnithine racemase